MATGTLRIENNIIFLFKNHHDGGKRSHQWDEQVLEGDHWKAFHKNPVGQG